MKIKVKKYAWQRLIGEGKLLYILRPTFFFLNNNNNNNKRKTQVMKIEEMVEGNFVRVKNVFWFYFMLITVFCP